MVLLIRNGVGLVGYGGTVVGLMWMKVVGLGYGAAGFRSRKLAEIRRTRMSSTVVWAKIGLC